MATASEPRAASVALHWLANSVTCLAGLVALVGSPSVAAANEGAMQAFAQNCFSPFLTAETAEANIASTGAQVDFYDLNPFSAVPPTPGKNITPGTDRRCEVVFDGDAGEDAAETAVSGLQAEGIRTEAPLPDTHQNAAVPGTTLLAARALNPSRIAVVHTGVRTGPNGVETFLSVERLTPKASEANQ